MRETIRTCQKRHHLSRTTMTLWTGLSALLAAGCQPAPEDVSFMAAESEAIDVPGVEIAPIARQANPSSPKLIRSGSARIEVADLDASINVVQELVERIDGYVAGSELREGREGARTATLELRMPADAFQGLVEDLPGVGRVLSVSVSTSDVSIDYFDTETRLAVQEETVRRLRDLSGRGGDLEDLLAAERELGRALTDLESLKGQLRYYDRRVAESDLHISLVEPGAVVGAGAFRPVVVALRDAGEVFGQSLAYLIYLLVVCLPWVVLLLILWPLAKRWRARQKARQGDVKATT